MLRTIALSLGVALAFSHVAAAADAQVSFEPKTYLMNQSGADLLKRVPAARPDDVSSPEAIVRAMHDAVSGPRGHWDDKRLRSLFVPEALIEFTDEGTDGVPRIQSISLDELVRMFGELHAQTSWYERAVSLNVVTMQRKGEKATLAVVNHTGDESTHPLTGPETKRPATSMTQVVKLQGRWWIVSHTW